MPFRRLNGCSLVQRQNTPGKCREDGVFQPAAQGLSCDGLIVLDQADANLQLMQKYGRNKGSAGSMVSFQTATLASALPLATLRNSDTTNVPSSSIRTGRPAWQVQCAAGAPGHRLPLRGPAYHRASAFCR
ncbi:hypothetical protein QO004_004204 [Rhizobium mesoamericanum]|nr:hypothetical protein [Rhizobium mesoamericanum]